MNAKILKKLLAGVVILYFIYCVYYLFSNRRLFQWDFGMQYHAARLFAEGVNPYDTEALKARTGNLFWYAYPPATLWFYRPFTLADYNTAYGVFLLLKVGVIIGLVLLWRTKFVARQAGAGFYFFCLLAFNGAIFLDMRSGNINMFEQLSIWLGFYFFLQRRLLAFCFFILLAACFKMTPLVFLLLILATDDKKRFLLFFGSCAAFLFYLLIQYAVAPEMFRAFLTAARDTLAEKSSSITIPSTIGVIYDGFRVLTTKTDTSASKSLQFGLFCVIALAIIFLTGRAYRILKSCNTEDKEKILLFIACLVYAMIHPRMKDYAYVLLIVPSYFIINRTGYSKIYPFLFTLPLLSNAYITLPGLGIVYNILWNYYPLVLAYLIWGLYLYEIFIAIQRPVSSVP